MTEKILLDTDIGSDIDDAVCLAYLLKQPECELLGITTVSGEPVKRAMLASALCKAAGKSVPICPGAEAPLLAPQRQPAAPQAEALERWAHDASFPRGEAVEFLRRTIRSNPGEVTLLAIGPLTNVALLFRADPEIPLLLKRFVLMCGVFTNRLAFVGPLEWNAMCDPHAAAIVYRSPVKVHRSIGLDVTCRVTMEKSEVNERFTAGILKPVADFAGVWFRDNGKLVFHDPLAAATIFDEGICRFERGDVEVELLSDKYKGMFCWTPDAAKGRHEAALWVDRDRFVEHYFSVVNR
jgi:purine nucleosidase